MTKAFGSQEWFESMFADFSKGYDKWGHQWKGSQQFRYDLTLKIFQLHLPSENKLRILDIGCGLGNFTKKIYDLDLKNEIIGIDLSKNAIQRAATTYPCIRFVIGSLPSLSFRTVSFDVILCLEVLYYLEPPKRATSLAAIKNTLKPEGILIFSGVLDGGLRYFEESDIINQISTYFDIMKIDYNYSKIYTMIESRFLLVLAICDSIKAFSNMSNEDFLKWYSQKKDRQTAELMKILCRSINSISSCRKILNILTDSIIRGIRQILSWKLPVIISYKLTKLIYGDNGKMQIIILARNK